MNWELILLIIIIVLFLAYIIISNISLSSERRKLKDDLANAKAKWNKYEALADFYKSKVDELDEKIQELTLQQGVAHGVQIQGELHSEDINTEIEKLKKERQEYVEKINQLSLQVTGLALVQYNSLQAIASSKEEQLQVENVTHGLENRNKDLSQEKQSLEVQVSCLKGELNKYLEMKQVVDKSINDIVWSPILKEKEAKLVSILQELKDLYPDLSVDFATIEWKKIWMPQLQDLGSAIDKVRGIYRLVLKDDKSYVVGKDSHDAAILASYIGQAVDIKDRWYQHVKKMIGVMSKGNERLYNYRPEDFDWCIVQQGSNLDLNECEKYWIDYYCCTDALNKKR